MRVLITGATGFLGDATVRAFLSRGVDVRVLVRPASALSRVAWTNEVEVVRADLRAGGDLAEAFEDVDVLVHLAACVTGDDEERFYSTVVGTERLLAAMARSRTRRLVLASSFSVYDWSEIRDSLDESSPLERDLYDRDGYAVAKLWQERVARRMSREHGFDLRVLRPGFIWGPGRTKLAGVGQQLGALHFLFGMPSRRLPLTHVENCADCFAEVALAERPDQTYNVVDDEGVAVARYAADDMRARGLSGLRIPVPYRLAYGITRLAWVLARICFGPRAKLPSLLVPARFEARFKPLRFSNRKLREELGWRPPLSYAEAVASTLAAGERVSAE